MVSTNLPPSDLRTPPNSKESEANLLSSIFIDGVQSLSKAMDGHIGPECFFDYANKQIYQAFLWLHRNGKELSLDVMIEELRRTGKLDSIQAEGNTAIGYLMEVSRKVPTTAELDYHIERVRETYVSRELIQSGRNVAELAYTEGAEVEKFTTEVNRILSIRHSTQVIKTLTEAAKQSIEKAIRIKNRMPTEQDIGLKLPWRDMNDKFGEAKPGELIIVGARPGIGKSSLARQIMWSWAEQYGDVALFSREMPVDQLPPLFAQTLSGISWKDFRKNLLHPGDQDDFIAALGDVQASKHLHVFDRDRTLSHVVARAKAMAQTKKLKAIAIDYLQRYDPEQSKGENRDIALGRMTMAFKDLAMDLKIPVILLAQIGRGVEREQREPRLSDLRECLAVDGSFMWTPQGILKNQSTPMVVTSMTPGGFFKQMDSRNAVRESAPETVQILLRSGRKIRCTPSHCVRTDVGWVQAKDLTEAHAIACPRTIDQPKNTEKIEAAKWMGWMLGNGSFVKGTPEFIASCDVVCSNFLDETERLFGFRPKQRFHSCSKVKQYTIAKNKVRTSEPNPVKAWLERADMWGCKAKSKCIPSWFCETADNESIAELLAGLWETDGCAHSTAKLSYSTTSEFMAHQVLWCLSRLSVFARIDQGYLSPKATVPCFKIIICDPLEIARFKLKIKVRGRKGDIINSYDLNTSNDCFGSRLGIWAGRLIESTAKSVGMPAAELGYRFQGKRIGQEDLSLCVLKLLEEGIQLPDLNPLVNVETYWDRLKSITPMGPSEVFDRVVPEHHNLVVNGICVHNSGNLEQDADNVIFLHAPAEDPISGVPQDPFDDQADQIYIEAIQAKGRGEGRGRCGLYFKKKTTTFRSITPEPKI